uniref:Uncharacterized protein n=1 Tax=Cyanothece sp. (strain PCC 7425 / ATCC 29141) TaxID=395961 RepID=B8HJQ4_CYAP4
MVNEHNPALHQEPLEQKTTVIYPLQDSSLLDQLERKGRLISNPTDRQAMPEDYGVGEDDLTDVLSEPEPYELEAYELEAGVEEELEQMEWSE